MRASMWLALICVVCDVARAGDLFERKVGLWKVTMQGASAASAHTVDQCLAADTDARLARQESAMMKAMCSKLDHRKVGNEFVTDAVCKIGAHASVSHTVTTPDGDSAYRSVITTHDPSAAQGSFDKVYRQEGRWVGACPSDMKPGDQILHLGSRTTGGIKSNVLTPSAIR